MLSYVQVDVDQRRQPGRWVLTGSANFQLHAGVSQSLAGRAALLELLPFSQSELRAGGWLADDLFTVLWKGGYPALFDRREEPFDWLGSYVATYVERDVRQALNVSDLLAFQTFLRLAAARTGRLLNLSQLGSDAGITHNTAKSWLGVLEASYLAMRLPAFHRNLGKRLVKAPKLHFLDTGLCCYLLGIRSPGELRLHPLRGAIFESWVVAELFKFYRHRGMAPRLSFFRDAHGLEVDLLVDTGRELLGVEAKSGQTVPVESFAPLESVSRLVPELRTRIVLHGGNESWAIDRGRALSHRGLDTFDWLSGGEQPAPD